MGVVEAVHDPLRREMDRDGQVHEGVDAGVDRLLLRPGHGDEDRVRLHRRQRADGGCEIGGERRCGIIDRPGIAAQEGDVDDGEADIPGLMPRDEGHHVLLAPDQEDRARR
jgi:hypothetical protein